MNNFDRIAPVYDKLVQLVFGKSMHRAQTCFLNEIPSDAHVLILGGGTGWIMKELFSVNPGCRVLYIDASAKMIEIAKERIPGSTYDVNFIHGTEQKVPDGLTFDAIITHFYLDLFDDDSCAKVTRRIRGCCHNGSLWLACDFIKVTWWHSAMIWLMYQFFSRVAGLQATKLPDWKKWISDSGLDEVRSRYFLKGFISSALFRLHD